jgi:hypothetical protein
MPVILLCGFWMTAQRGKRGQKFFHNLVAALDAMPEKRLVTSVLQDEDGEVCVLGAALKHAGKECPISEDEDDFDQEWTAAQLDIATQLVAETVCENDEGGWNETPEERWTRMRRWANSKLKPVSKEDVIPDIQGTNQEKLTTA